MALLYMDSYDYLATGANPSVAFWAAQNCYNISTAGLTTVAGAFGGTALQITANGPGGAVDMIQPQWASGISDETIIGQRMFFFGSAQTVFAVGNSATGVQFSLQGTVFGELLLLDHAGSIIARTSPATFELGKWDYYELRFSMSGNSGRIRLRRNTELVMDFTGTYGTGGLGKWNFLRWNGSGGSGITMGWDDLYVLTTAASPNNDYLGNVRVRCQLPSAPGDVTDMTPTGAATNWQAQINPNFSLTQYVSTATVGDYDLYDLQANSSARNIFGVQARGMFMQDDATQLTGELILKTEGTEYPSSPFLTSSSYRTYYGLFDNNPSTGVPWTNTEVNAAQIGPKLYASA